MRAAPVPILIAFMLQIGARVLLAASTAEVEAAHSFVHVAVAPDGRICGMVKAGRRMLDTAVLQVRSTSMCL